MKCQFLYVLLVSVVLPVSAADELPSRENLTGNWQWTSYLLNPGSFIAPEPPKLPTSIASVWAKGKLEMQETPMAGEGNTLKGTLTFPSGVKLNVQGRRVKGEGDIEEFVFRGTSEKPIKMVFEIRGTFSAPWPKDSNLVNLRGYIRNVEGDPYAPGAIGAFVLIPDTVAAGKKE